MTKRKVIFNLILLSLITSVFLVFGALVFSKIEGKQRGINPEESTKSLRESISKKYNISDKEFLELHRSFKTLIEAEDDWLKSDWTFYEALYFAGSVITTVGYGHISPVTFSGRLFCIFYAVFGIPLNIITLKVYGETINKIIAFGIASFERKFFHREPKNEKIKLMLVASMLMVVELLLGGILYNYTENWSYLSSVYYCFIVFSTIGFGDLVPNSGQAPNNNTEIFLMFVRGGLLIVGLSTLSSLLTAVVNASTEIKMALPPRLRNRTLRRKHLQVAPSDGKRKKIERSWAYMDGASSQMVSNTSLTCIPQTLSAEQDRTSSIKPDGLSPSPQP